MRKLRKAEEEYRTARRALSSIRESENIDEVRDGWKNFIAAVERLWQKLDKSCKNEPSYHSWRGTYVRLRSEDSLITYVRQARNADTHTIQDISRVRGLGIPVMIPSPIPTFEPTGLDLLPVSNRGKTYPVPDYHLGEKLGKCDPITIAEKALEFYKRALIDARDTFGLNQSKA